VLLNCPGCANERELPAVRDQNDVRLAANDSIFFGLHAGRVARLTRGNRKNVEICFVAIGVVTHVVRWAAWRPNHASRATSESERRLCVRAEDDHFPSGETLGANACSWVLVICLRSPVPCWM